MDGIGGGLAALAFWGFIGSIVVAGIWYGIREREAQHETFRRVIESGQPVDQALMDKVLGGDKVVHRDLKIGGLIVLSTAPGVAVAGWLISILAEAWLFPMLGVAALLAFVGTGLLVASKAAERSARENDASTLNRNMAP
jgi:undecaprenyl pyrophosphate phosphatase UppP